MLAYDMECVMTDEGSRSSSHSFFSLTAFWFRKHVFVDLDSRRENLSRQSINVFFRVDEFPISKRKSVFIRERDQENFKDSLSPNFKSLQTFSHIQSFPRFH